MNIICISLLIVVTTLVFGQNDSIDVTINLKDSNIISGKIKNPNYSDFNSFSKLKVITNETKPIIVRPELAKRITFHCKGIDKEYLPVTDKHGERFIRIYEFGSILLLKEDYRYCYGKITTPKKSSCFWTRTRRSIYLEKNGILSKSVTRTNFRKTIRPFVCDKPSVCNMIKKRQYNYRNIYTLIKDYNRY